MVGARGSHSARSPITYSRKGTSDRRALVLARRQMLVGTRRMWTPRVVRSCWWRDWTRSCSVVGVVGVSGAGPAPLAGRFAGVPLVGRVVTTGRARDGFERQALAVLVIGESLMVNRWISCAMRHRSWFVLPWWSRGENQGSPSALLRRSQGGSLSIASTPSIAVSGIDAAVVRSESTVVFRGVVFYRFRIRLERCLFGCIVGVIMGCRIGITFIAARNDFVLRFSC